MAKKAATKSFKNKNDVLIKTTLNYAIEKININDFESDSDRRNSNTIVLSL